MKLKRILTEKTVFGILSDSIGKRIKVVTSRGVSIVGVLAEDTREQLATEDYGIISIFHEDGPEEGLTSFIVTTAIVDVRVYNNRP